MEVQVQKIERYCAWTGLTIAAHKCTITGILHKAKHEGMVSSASDWGVLKPMLESVKLGGQSVQLVKPGRPFKFLGVLFMLSLNWSFQFAAAQQLIYDKGQKLIDSMASMDQSLIIEELCILSTLNYSLCVAPYSANQIKQLDRLRARTIIALSGYATLSPIKY